MDKKRQQQEQACRAGSRAEEDCWNSLPELEVLPKPEALDDEGRALRGEEAGAFLNSPEHGYLAGKKAAGFPHFSNAASK